jgi:hypothetical protein
MSVEPQQIAEGNDTVLVQARVTARGAASGVELEVDSYLIYWFDGGLIRRVENYTNRETAERAANLTLG